MNWVEVHQAALGWAQSCLELLSRPGDDRLWDRQGRSYKVKGRTATRGWPSPSFDVQHGHAPFDYLIGVVFDADGDVIRAFRVDQATFNRLAHVNRDSVRLRLSDRGTAVHAVEWLVGAPGEDLMTRVEQFRPSYLPKRIRRCPQCGDRDQVKIIIYGMPAGPPTPEEKDRVLFAGCVMPVYDDPEQEPPKWHCPTCEVSYTGRGEIVAEPDEW